MWSDIINIITKIIKFMISVTNFKVKLLIFLYVLAVIGIIIYIKL